MNKAVVVHQTGGPEVLTFEDWPVAGPGPGQVRIRQTAIGLNFIDTYQRSGLYPDADCPSLPAMKGPGVVTAVGRRRDRLQASAIASPIRGRSAPMPRNGCCRPTALVPIPDGIDDRTAAAVMLKGLTAYYLLFKTWPVQKGETILWHAAAGGDGPDCHAMGQGARRHGHRHGRQRRKGGARPSTWLRPCHQLQHRGLCRRACAN